MKFKGLCASLAILGMAGCEVTRGGTGSTTTGEPVVAEFRQYKNFQQSVTLTSVKGWQCVGYFVNERRNNVVDSFFQVPLGCSNGVTGNSLVYIDRLNSKAEINFELSNGLAGNAEIG